MFNKKLVEFKRKHHDVIVYIHNELVDKFKTQQDVATKLAELDDFNFPLAGFIFAAAFFVAASFNEFTCISRPLVFCDP